MSVLSGMWRWPSEARGGISQIQVALDEIADALQRVVNEWLVRARGKEVEGRMGEEATSMLERMAEGLALGAKRFVSGEVWI